MIDPMHVLEILKDAAKVAQTVGQLGLQKQILEAENEVRELTREKRRLEDRLEELERKLKVRAAMTFKAPFCYQQGDVTPFCPACYEGKEERAVHLTQHVDGWRCTVCKNVFHENPEDDADAPAFGIVPMSRG
jgi:hypothetical protein